MPAATAARDPRRRSAAVPFEAAQARRTLPGNPGLARGRRSRSQRPQVARRAGGSGQVGHDAGGVRRGRRPPPRPRPRRVPRPARRSTATGHPPVGQRRAQPALLQVLVGLPGSPRPRSASASGFDLSCGDPLLQVGDHFSRNLPAYRAPLVLLRPDEEAPGEQERLGAGRLQPPLHVANRRAAGLDRAKRRLDGVPELRRQRVSQAPSAPAAGQGTATSATPDGTASSARATSRRVSSAAGRPACTQTKSRSTPSEPTPEAAQAHLPPRLDATHVERDCLTLSGPSRLSGSSYLPDLFGSPFRAVCPNRLTCPACPVCPACSAGHACPVILRGGTRKTVLLSTSTVPPCVETTAFPTSRLLPFPPSPFPASNRPFDRRRTLTALPVSRFSVSSTARVEP